MKAIIFDMNGVIINDERFHQESWRELIGRNPNVFRMPSEEQFKHEVFGRSERATLEYLLGCTISSEELEAYSQERVENVKRLFDPLILADGLKPLLDQFKSEKVPVGIATGSRPNYVNHILDGLDIRPHFQAVITADDIKRSKPDPEIYLKTAQVLGIKPEDCVVFEDTISGIRAGQAAGMHVIAITSTHRADELTLANEIIRSFNEIKLREGGQLQVERRQVTSYENQRPAFAQER